MKDIKKFLAIFLGKILGFASILTGSGGGAAPGFCALKIYPEIIADLCKNIEKQKIIVTATNGKTTTTAMIRAILDENCDSYISNQTGSNLARGLASSLIAQSNMLGQFRADYGVFEVDEAVLPYAIEQIKPDIVILGNVFRDQLDRYGEIDTILAKWKNSLVKTKRPIKLVLNGDDPGIAGIRDGLKLETIFYGIDANTKSANNVLEHAADSINCPLCFRKLQYVSQQFSHLGNYSCTNCGFKRPKIDIAAYDIEESLDETCFKIDKKDYKLGIGGTYNVYNALAAVGVARLLDISDEVIYRALENIKPAFGRMEEFTIGKQKYKMILIKNPTGANAVINILKNIQNKNIVIALNDKIADGTDVSWIYDVDWENLDAVRQFICMGTRKYDMALRLKYASYEEKQIIISEDWIKATEKINSECVYILPTYTAMLEIRNQLEKKKIVNKIV